ncbi:MAG: ketopantoate reductase family protein [Cellulosilyticum sp.]|nr:ketopantoate reductase family protein [Cellulosilyticum sp.]
MKILVYGAGVLGSYLAHELNQGQHHDVTILARGKRYEAIKQNGLVINHVRQKSETVDKLHVVNQLKAEDAYDVIFVVMQKSQLNSILQVLAENTTSKVIVFIGNNTEADITYKKFMQHSHSKPTVLFRFLSCGGRREGEKVYSWHSNNYDITLGTVNKMKIDKNNWKKVILGTHLKLDLKPDMNAWLKYHSALITPLCMAIQYEDGETKKLHHSKVLKLSIEALKECLCMFEHMGFLKDSPHDMKLLKWPTTLLYYAMALLLPTKTGRLIAISHALAAKSEVEMLKEELLNCSKTYHYPLPSFNMLCELHNEKHLLSSNYL